jgi:hypothetical protein
MRGKVFAPLNKDDFIPHRGKGCRLLRTFDAAGEVLFVAAKVVIRANHVTVSFPLVRNEADCIRSISAQQATKAAQCANRGSKGERAKECKSAGLPRSNTVDLRPHWRKQNRDAVWSADRLYGFGQIIAQNFRIEGLSLI